MTSHKFVFLKQISLLLIAAKLFVDYEITWVEVFIPLYIGIAVELLHSLLEYLERYFKALAQLKEKVGKQ
jgi:hypothetical protein